MANKYIIHGATFNGDGTDSAEAASDGAAGAWNNINIMTGTTPAYGSLGAGDKVTVRSKTSGGADVLVTIAANTSIGSAAATVSAPVTWVVDGGTVWPEANGTLTFESAGAYQITFQPYNWVRAEIAERFVTRWTGASSGSLPTTLVQSINNYIKHWFFDVPNIADAWSRSTLFQSTTLDRPRVRCGIPFSVDLGVLRASGGHLLLINPEIELLGSDPVRPNVCVFALDGFGSSIRAVGGRLFGAGAQSAASNALVKFLASDRAGVFESIGFQVPKALRVAATATGLPSFPTHGGAQSVRMYGLDGGAGGQYVSTWGSVDSRNFDNYYPTLNATILDSAGSGSSWRVYPLDAQDNRPLELVVSKLFSGSPASHVVTLEMLLANPWTGSAVNRSNLWADVSYFDNATGEQRYLTTRLSAATALDESLAAWSATTWGAVGFVKRKLEVTTPSAIKQDTAVTVTLRGTIKAANANEILVVCPDPQLT